MHLVWANRGDGVTFYTKPHIGPHNFDGKEIGVDVCDDCNHYFDTAPKAGMLLLTK